MTDQEQEIVARAIWVAQGGVPERFDAEFKRDPLMRATWLGYARDVTLALDTHRIERAGEVEETAYAMARLYSGAVVGEAFLKAAALISSLQSEIVQLKFGMEALSSDKSIFALAYEQGKLREARMLTAIESFLECWDWNEEINTGTSPPITAEHIAHGQKIMPEAVEELRSATSIKDISQ